MRKYVLTRLLRSLVSIIAVIAIVYVLIYSLIPRDNIFLNDPIYTKMSTQDLKTNYRYQRFEQFGYVDYATMGDYCKVLYPDLTSIENFNCNRASTPTFTNPAINDFNQYYANLGYTTQYLTSGKPYAYKDNSPFAMMLKWFSTIITFQHVNQVQNELDPDIERNIYVGRDWNNVPALMCSGCDNKYLIYFDNSFPFIHFNFVKLNLGNSFPLFADRDIINVISSGQGNNVIIDITYPTGLAEASDVNEHTCVYKPTLSPFVQARFTDNYASCQAYYSDPSMLSTSFTIGILAMLLSYIIGLPIGIFMAKYKNRTFDKIAMLYIIFIIAVPSLAYIFMFSRIGAAIGLPVKFPVYGAHNSLSYILPIFSLALPAAAGLMMWIRRFMIDQTSSDYVKFARSKGLTETEIFSKHILRNAIIPIVHGIPMSIVGTLTGAIITERVYAVPGMGKMLTSSINAFDNSLIVALTFIFTALSVLALLLGDILITFVDPRISFVESGGRK